MVYQGPYVGNPDGARCTFSGNVQANTWYYFVDPTAAEGKFRVWFGGGFTDRKYRRYRSDLDARSLEIGFEIVEYKPGHGPLDANERPPPRTSMESSEVEATPLPAERPGRSRFVDDEAGHDDGSDDEPDGSMGSSTAAFFTDGSELSESSAASSAIRSSSRARRSPKSWSIDLEVPFSAARLGASAARSPGPARKRGRRLLDSPSTAASSNSTASALEVRASMIDVRVRARTQTRVAARRDCMPHEHAPKWRRLLRWHAL